MTFDKENYGNIFVFHEQKGGKRTKEGKADYAFLTENREKVAISSSTNFFRPFFLPSLRMQEKEKLSLPL